MKVGDKVKIKLTDEVGTIKTSCAQCKWHVSKENGEVELVYSEKELELLTKTPDEKVLDYLERANNLYKKMDVNTRVNLGKNWLIEIAKLLQREEKL